MSNDKELTRENLEEVREYECVEWAEDELANIHDFLQESGLATRLRQPDSIDQVLAEIFPAPVDNHEAHGRDREAHLMDSLVELVEDVAREHIGGLNPAAGSPSAGRLYPFAVDVAADDLIATPTSFPTTPRATALPEREPTVLFPKSSLMEVIDRYQRSLDQSASGADSQPSSTTQSDDSLPQPRFNTPKSHDPLSSGACSSTTAENRESYFNVGRGEATPSISDTPRQAGDVTPLSSSSSRQQPDEVTPSSASCRPPAATCSSSGRRRKATEYTPSTDMGGMCLDTPTTSKRRRMLRRQRVGLTSRVPPPLPIPSRNWTLARPTQGTTIDDAAPAHVSPGVAAAAAGSLAPRALVWSYQEEAVDRVVPAADVPPAEPALDTDDVAAVAAAAAAAVAQVPDTTTTEQQRDDNNRDAPRSRWAELRSAMKGSRTMQGLTTLANDLRARLGIHFSVDETMDKMLKQIKLKALLRTVYRFFHEENSSMKDLFKGIFETEEGRKK